MRRNISLAVDTETGGLLYRDHKLLLAQFCTIDGEVVMVRRPDHFSDNLLELLNDSGICWLLHHAKFDYQFIRWWTGAWGENRIGSAYNGPMFECTKTLAKMFYPELGSGLSNLMKHLLKNEGKHFVAHGQWDRKKLTKKQIKYAAEDVTELHKLHDAMLKGILIKGGTHDEVMYRDTVSNILDAAELEVQGFTDLHSYDQTDKELVQKNRTAWKNRPFNLSKSLAEHTDKVMREIACSKSQALLPYPANLT